MKFAPLLSGLTLTAAMLLMAPSSSHAALLAGWDFQGSVTAPGAPVGTVISQAPNTPKVFTANDGVYQSTSNLYFDGTNGSSDFVVSAVDNNSTELGALNSITANAGGTTNLSTAAGVGSIALWNRSTHPTNPLPGIDGKSAVFKLSMVGYESLQFSFAVQRPNSDPGNYGVSVFTFAYSTDGITYDPWGVIDTGFGAVLNQAYTLSTPLSAVDGESNVYIRMTVSGSTAGTPVGSSNSTRIDNIQFNAVPEPGGMLLLISTVSALAFRRRR